MSDGKAGTPGVRSLLQNMRLGAFLRRIAAILLFVAAGCVLCSVGPSPEDMRVGTLYGNRVLVTTNQLLAPIGTRIQFPGRPLDLVWSPSGRRLAVLFNSVLRFYAPSGQPLLAVSISPSAGGLAFLPDGSRVVVSQMKSTGEHGIAIIDPTGASIPRWLALPNSSGPAGIAVDPAGNVVYVALNLKNALARIDLSTGQVSSIAVGIAPLSVAVTPDGSRVFVTNQGGHRPSAGQMTASSAGSAVLVDDRGIPASGTVSVVDTRSFTAIAELTTGLLPAAVRVSPDGLYAAVANANSDSVTFFLAATLQRTGTVSITGQPSSVGSSPTALAFDSTGDRLYVTCGGNNSVAVLVRRAIPRRFRIWPTYSLAGLFPTDWYPVAIAIAGDGTVFVANSKGIGTQSGNPPFNITAWTGTLSILLPPTIDSSLSQGVADANDPFRNAGVPGDSPPDLHALGIRHVFFVIKENRSFDQVLGDMAGGNGDPTLTTYGAGITPNQHALASQFVLLDNFYASGTVSPDGHAWLTQSMATSYLERAYPTFSRSYPYSGEDPLAFAPTGFLWTNAQAHGLTVRVYGEYTQAVGTYPLAWADYLQDAAGPLQTNTPSRSPIAALNPYIDPTYPAFALNVPDTYRARRFLDAFRQFQASDTLPNLVIIQLPADHTVGVTPNAPTPNAMIADNDVAVGRIVEAVSNSSYWPTSAIFITEDDAQDGFDHVDGHRTVCLVISPYTRRHALDSTYYNHTSIVRTIEDLLGLPTMNKFDAAALPMRSVFATQRDPTAFYAVPANISPGLTTPVIGYLSGALRNAALASAAMNFAVPDAAPEEELNRILWHAARGWHTPYPRARHASSCPRGRD